MVAPRYATQEEANAALAREYALYIQRRFGREPSYESDLYCSMAQNSEGACWWMALDHPMAFVLRNAQTPVVWELQVHSLVAYANQDVEAAALHISRWFACYEHVLLSPSGGVEGGGGAGVGEQ